MSKKSYIVIASTGIITLLCIIFAFSYNWGMNRFNNRYYPNGETGSEDKAASNLSLGDTISSDTKIILKIEYKKSGDVDTKEEPASQYIGKNKQDLEKLGYEVESITSKEVTLVKEVDSYAPNKYVLGVKDKYFVIYKTDGNGNLYIENEQNDVTDIEVPTEGDYELLVKGSKDFQFNTKEEVEEKLGEYAS